MDQLMSMGRTGADEEVSRARRAGRGVAVPLRRQARDSMSSTDAAAIDCTCAWGSRLSPLERRCRCCLSRSLPLFLRPPFQGLLRIRPEWRPCALRMRLLPPPPLHRPVSRLGNLPRPSPSHALPLCLAFSVITLEHTYTHPSSSSSSLCSRCRLAKIRTNQASA